LCKSAEKKQLRKQEEKSSIASKDGVLSLILSSTPHGVVWCFSTLLLTRTTLPFERRTPTGKKFKNRGVAKFFTLGGGAKVHFDFERASSRVRFPAALLRSCSFFSSRAGESTHMHMVSSVSVNDFSSMIFLRVSSGK